MENASKALIMAGAIIVAIVIVSLGIWAFRRSSELVTDRNWSEVEINEFNSKLEPYCGDSISGSQVNALIERVRSLDKAAASSEGESLYTKIVHGSEVIEVTKSGTTWSVTDTMKKVATGGQYYKVEKTYDSSMRINTITITP